MNRRGFTLVELIAVLVVLALLLLLVSGTVSNIINKAKVDISDAQEKSILNAAEKWSIDNSEFFDDTEGNKIQIGLDVVFILDMSGSMGTVDVYNESGNRISRNKAMIDAVNEAMLILGEGENTRMAIVLYGSTGITYLPLANYKTTNGQYIYNSGRYIYASTGLLKDGSPYSKSRQNLSGCTYTQIGISTGANILLNNSDTQNRIPVMIMLSDGAPSYGHTNYKNVGTTKNVGDCMTAGDQHSAYYTIKSAKYYKEAVKAHYNNATTFFYTVGFSLDSGSYEEVVLNPTPELVENLKSNRNSIARGLTNYLNNDPDKDFSYADASYIGKMDADTLKTVFSEISTTVVEASKVTLVCVTVQELYDKGYLSTNDVDLADGQAASEYVLMSYNEPTNQYKYSFARTDEQKRTCQEYLEAQEG